MRRRWLPVLLALIVTDAGCGSRDPVLIDGGPPPDSVRPDAAPLDAAPLDLARPDLAWPDLFLRDTVAPDSVVWVDLSSPPTVDFVVSRFIMPGPSTAAQLGWDYNNDGAPDNALGSILGALNGLASGVFDMQWRMDAAVYSGNLLQLMRLYATDLLNDPAATLQSWEGAPQTCCQTPTNVPLCGAQAAATCFNGSHSFAPDPTDPQGTLLQGSIVGGAMHFSAPKMKLRLALGTAGLVKLEIKAVHITGSVSSTGIANGVLAGAIEQADLQNKLIPALVVLFNQVLQDPTASQSVKDTITTLFDANKDYVITVAEFSNNAIVKTFLSGDVDVDYDGMNELSLGLGFKAVGAVITP
jgi:hypothetical protein